MKRIFILISVLFMVFLSSCKQSFYLDCDLFCELYNKQIKDAEISVENALIKKDSRNIAYSFFINQKDDFLITLYSDNNDLRLKRCSLTVLSSPAQMQNGNSQKFLDLSKTVISIFSRNKDNAQEVIKNLNIKANKNYKLSYPKYFETNFFNYSYQLNEFGACLTIENKLLSLSNETALTLRNEKIKKVSP